MDDVKRILVISDGGTGRSYHAELVGEEYKTQRAIPARSWMEG